MDISRFHAAFFEESREGLQAMEAGLLRLESAEPDLDTINVVFRAAHSIKGGAATFGFRAVTDLTHLLETLLEEARAGSRRLDGASVDALLEAVDVLGGLLQVAEHGGEADGAALNRVQEKLQALLDGAAAPQAAAGTPEE